MGIFSAFKKGDTEKKIKDVKEVPWIVLNKIEQIEEIKEQSKSIPVAIFKHSTRCGISRMVLRGFEKTYAIDTSKMKLYYLDLLAYRNISDAIGFEFQIMHQSPQLIVIKNATAVAHSSHNGIQADELTNFI
jgi:bacillithiol system protein YtxJ